MDVLFTNPPNVRWRRGQIFYGCRAGSRWPWSSPNGPTEYACFPFFMAYACATLQEHGVEAHLYDTLVRQEFDYGPYIDRVREMAPQIVVIETSTPTIDIDLSLARRFAYFSEVALSGPHATIFADDLIKFPYVRYVLKGEYELSSLAMWKTRAPGIYDHIAFDDVDKSPYPYRDPEVINGYWEPTMQTPRPQLQVYASRGCPFKCTYCMWPKVMYNRQFRARKPKAVADEIRYCISSFGSKSILFDDDTFNIGTERISALCDELSSIGLPWSMMGRLDTSPEWLFDKMVDSGCTGMRFGVETFSEKIQKNIKKDLDTDKAISMLRYLKQKHPNMPIHITTMHNLPGENSEDRKYNWSVIKELGFDDLNQIHNHQLSTCIPFPGTELYEQLDAMGFGEQLRDFYAYDGSPSIESELSKAIATLGRSMG